MTTISCVIEMSFFHFISRANLSVTAAWNHALGLDGQQSQLSRVNSAKGNRKSPVTVNFQRHLKAQELRKLLALFTLFTAIFVVHAILVETNQLKSFNQIIVELRSSCQTRRNPRSFRFSGGICASKCLRMGLPMLISVGFVTKSLLAWQACNVHIWALLLRIGWPDWKCYSLWNKRHLLYLDTEIFIRLYLSVTTFYSLYVWWRKPNWADANISIYWTSRIAYIGHLESILTDRFFCWLIWPTIIT